MERQKPEIRAAVFDLDGTLIDSMGVWERVDRAFLTAHGFAQDEFYIQSLKDMNYRECAEFTIRYLQVTMTPAELMQEWDDLAEWEYGHTIELKPGAKALLLKLKERNIPAVLATVSSSRLYEAVLKRFQVDTLFAGFTDEKAADKGKDHPDIYLQAASIAGTAPSHTIVFEDILKGIRSAGKAGFVTCAVEDPSQAADRDAIRQAADYYVRDLREADRLFFL